MLKLRYWTQLILSFDRYKAAKRFLMFTTNPGKFRMHNDGRKGEQFVDNSFEANDHLFWYALANLHLRSVIEVTWRLCISICLYMFVCLSLSARMTVSARGSVKLALSNSMRKIYITRRDSSQIIYHIDSPSLKELSRFKCARKLAFILKRNRRKKEDRMVEDLRKQLVQPPTWRHYSVCFICMQLRSMVAHVNGMRKSISSQLSGGFLNLPSSLIVNIQIISGKFSSKTSNAAQPWYHFTYYNYNYRD